MKIPVVDMAECTDCEACLETCPEIFRRNEAGYIEVIDLSEYPEDSVDEAIRNCCSGCISWEDMY
jgi:ferredoxin